MNNDAGEEIAELQSKLDELERENAKLSERKCPGYDADTHYCNYHAQDFELNDKTVSRLKRENAKLSSDELHWHSQAEHYRNMYERM
jgi:FtsZ-binding cell division protein ZapB